MSDIMYPMAFGSLMTHVLEEKRMHNRVFNVDVFHQHPGTQELSLFGKKLENPVGPSAGPHTQLAQNIVAAYVAGCRFIELKTVQIMYGEELGIPRPCINSVDEGYNVEWSSEYPTEMALDEYVKAWVACKVIAKEFGLGDPDGFLFNMSVGYNLEGIKSPRVDAFIEGLKNATNAESFKAAKQWLLDHMDLFQHIDADFVNGISPEITDSISLSTMHGCPAEEIEGICEYLLTEKGLKVYLKCNPTLLGYDKCRELLDSIGYDYVQFAKEQFEIDLGKDAAIPMIKRLQKVAEENNTVFGVKLTNTFPVSILKNELPGDTMYMSGKALYPLSMNVAKLLATELDGNIRISYSGGVDTNNIKDLFEAGIWPLTVCTILLQGRGYAACDTLAKKCLEVDYQTLPTGIDVAKLTAVVDAIPENPRAKKTPAMAKKREEQPGFPNKHSESYTCRVTCGNCVRVCPNRANEFLQVGNQKLIIHVDLACNECGNCACGCVEPCQPYKDRITFFHNEEAMANSTNDGFCKKDGKWAYRFEGKAAEGTLEELPAPMKDIIAAFEKEHPYYL